MSSAVSVRFCHINRISNIYQTRYCLAWFNNRLSFYHPALYIYIYISRWIDIKSRALEWNWILKCANSSPTRLANHHVVIISAILFTTALRAGCYLLPRKWTWVWGNKSDDVSLYRECFPLWMDLHRTYVKEAWAALPAGRKLILRACCALHA